MKSLFHKIGIKLLKLYFPIHKYDIRGQHTRQSRQTTGDTTSDTGFRQAIPQLARA